jgi:DNA-binding transcriptional MerR regulator
VTDRDFASIGEVLNLLTEEFPDITISKIRFLESQGLIDPERTAAGYRKFYEADIERLRFILREQREHFLPLKVIKDRLGEDDSEDPADVDTARHPANPRPDRVPAWMSDPRVKAAKPVPADATVVPLGAIAATGANLTVEELSEACGLDAAAVKDLERFGLIHGRVAGRFTYYDEEALVVAKLAAAFAEHGVEARHLRMYRSSAEREAALFEQLIVAFVRQRNPQAKAQARDTLVQLDGLGAQLRAAMMRQALQGYLSP